LFVTFYSKLYAGDMKNKLNITDMKTDLESRFDREKAMLQDPKSGFVALRAMQGGNLVGLIVLRSTQKAGQLRLMRCALDVKNIDMFAVGQALKKGVFEKNPGVTSIVNVCHKESFFELGLLKEFGFVECSLVDNSYDAGKYTSFEVKK